MTKIAISQPTYLSWLGYFEQIAKSDYFVFLDTVQYERQSWQSRNRIKDQHDIVHWLSVPVANQPLETAVADIQIALQKGNWQRKHLNAIRTYLAKTPFLPDVLALLETVYQQQHTKLADLNIALITAVCQALGIGTTLLRASELGVTGTKADLLLQIIQQLKGTCYFANQGSRTYLEQEQSRFLQQGVSIVYQHWQHPQYQQKGEQFISHLAWPDAVAYLGFNKSALNLPDIT
ncbi:WbqC family protein [Arsukibacterium sp.]|uniref:WbqC family protein n=1 Tax=Arsukibacterium sp. TaxID=1977258 RepID=UPI00299D89B3|nr:WbqC family protein [Arsukibacterium sp.]MDX1677257.1 WbqC family protein [Arsukibacterium sp.]